MASVSDLRDGFTSQRKNREHLYAIAVTSDDATWPVVTTEFFDGHAYDAADDFCGPRQRQLKSEDSIGLSVCSELFPSRSLDYRWVVVDDRLWQFCFIDDRSRLGNRPADTNEGNGLLVDAIKSFELLARSAAKELNLPATTGPDNDIATMWLACLLPAMAETRRGEFLIRRTSADVFSESVSVLDALAAATQHSAAENKSNTSDVTQLPDHGGMIVETQTITPPILSHEGPLPPNQLLANGRTVDLERKPFKLVEFFWRRPMNDRVLVDTVAGNMWKPNQTWTPGGFANAVTKANAALLEVGAAWTLSQKDGFVLKS